MKRYNSLLLVLLAFSLIGNGNLFNKNQESRTELLEHEVSSFKTLTQNTLTGLKQDNSALLKQTYSNLQSNPPFGSRSFANTEQVLNKYEQIFKDSMNDKQGSHSQEIAQLEKIFKILVQLSEKEKISEKDVKSSFTKIDAILAVE
ncbi:hypothetical protein J7E38_23745 [Bacillus sp. ISL-35]|uniref:hypothetical protein n=1 Tax=Bacillus sp. ISL-35 TaxID=2819122 RepID=UPI001BEB4878|nr:hypothetical protein [Bacillus sp. ISL-35]MBT2681978.1 hypothetical protein [Bacillus sp. ISL-35]MBT2706138.1 hypothetical protein [Chryseobacterium sp. ISL-80]